MRPSRLVLLLLVGAFSSGITAASPSEPSPKRSPATWVTSNDYPARAQERQVEGNVRARLGVSPSGLPTACTVMSSSGSEELDAKTCQLLMARARFEPARNASGVAIAGSWSTTIAWRIPDDARVAPALRRDDAEPGYADDQAEDDYAQEESDGWESFSNRLTEIRNLDCRDPAVRRADPEGCDYQDKNF